MAGLPSQKMSPQALEGLKGNERSYLITMVGLVHYKPPASSISTLKK